MSFYIIDNQNKYISPLNNIQLYIQSDIKNACKINWYNQKLFDKNTNGFLNIIDYQFPNHNSFFGIISSSSINDIIGNWYIIDSDIKDYKYIYYKIKENIYYLSTNRQILELSINTKSYFKLLII